MLMRKTVRCCLGTAEKIENRLRRALKNRAFPVKLGGQLSSEGIVKSGVPQGFVFGPLLFLIFRNDLEDERTCNHLFSVDDLKLIGP